MDYDDVDRSMTNELYRASVWACPVCGATRPVREWRNFTSQSPPREPCKLCGHLLEHGILTSDDGKVGFWFRGKEEP